MDLLSRVNFVNLVKLLGFSQEGNKRALVYEYAEQGALWDHLHGESSHAEAFQIFGSLHWSIFPMILFYLDGVTKN